MVDIKKSAKHMFSFLQKKKGVLAFICLIIACQCRKSFFTVSEAYAGEPLRLTASCPVATGKPYRTPDDEAVYLVTPECTKRPFFNPAVYFSFFDDWSRVVFIERPVMDQIPDDVLHFLPWGPLRSFENGSLVKLTSDPKVYLLLNGKAYPFESEASFRSFGYRFDQIEDVAQAVLKKFEILNTPIKGVEDIPASVVFLYQGHPEVYVLVSQGDQFVKSHLLSMEEVKKVYRPDRIVTIPEDRVFADGPEIGSPPPSESTDRTVATSTQETASSTDVLSLNIPAGTSTVSGVIGIKAVALNHASVSSVRYLIGNTSIGTVTSSLQTVTVDTNRFANGTYAFTAIITESSGTVSSLFRTLIIKNTIIGGGGGGGGGSSSSNQTTDTTAPTVTSFTIPLTSNSSTVPVTSFTATDNVAVTGYLITQSTSTPSSSDAGWSATAQTSYAVATDGLKILYGWAKDAQGNISASASDTVTVDTTGPIVSGVVSSTFATMVTVTWTTDELSTSTVEYGTTLAYGNTSSSSIATTTHSVVLLGLTPATSYHFRISSQDALGNVVTSGDYLIRTAAALSSLKALTVFDFNALIPPVTGIITEGSHAVALTVPFGTNVTALVPTITTTGVSVSPASGVARDFTSPQTYTVTAEDASTQAYIVTVTIAADAIAPTVTAFAIPSTSNSRTVPVTSFTATDNVAVTGYLVNESASTPSASDPGWSGTAQTEYIFTTDGSKTLYAWAKDALNNISTSFSSSIVVDSTGPIISSIASSTAATTATITWTTDENSTSTVEYGTTTSYGSASTSVILTTSHSIVLTGLSSYTTYHFRVVSQDAYGNITTSSDAVFKTLDATAPTVTAFTIPSTSNSRTVPVTSFTATDNVAVTGYLVNESASTPSASDPGWSGTAQTEYIFTTDGSKTLYAWAKDALNNISTSTSRAVIVDTAAPIISSVASSTMETTATISWTTDENSTSTVEYGTTTSYGSASTSAALVTAHTINLTGLTASTTYHFRVASQDAYGHVATSSDATFTTPAASVYNATLPRVGLNDPAYASAGTASLINDGSYMDPYAWTFSGCSTTTPCWVAIHLSTSSSKLLLQWADEMTGDNFSTTKTTKNYSIQVSSDSTNGSNGTWVTSTDAISGQPVVVTGNTYIYRAHKINFTGYSWVKMRITSSAGTGIDEIDMWDASTSTDDTYYFDGDSITNMSTLRGTDINWGYQPSFQADVATSHTGRFPMQTGGGTVGAGAEWGDQYINDRLAAFPMSKYWFFIYGTNDLCWMTPSSWSASVQSWITKVKAAGRIPILVHPIWGNNVSAYCSNNGPSFNTAIDALVTSNNLLPAVPLYEGTVGHSEYFYSGDVHPVQEGIHVWNQIFATYVQRFYSP